MAKKFPVVQEKVNTSFLARISEELVPPQYTGTTSIEASRRNYDVFERADNTGDSHSDVQQIYSGDAMKTATLEAPTDNVKTLLARNSLEEHRVKTGLDKLREKLEQKLVEHIDFQKGIDRLYDHITQNRPPYTPNVHQFGYLGDDRKQNVVSAHYPDLTADEVAWYSITKEINVCIFDGRAPVYYPLALVGMDFEGLKFGLGTIDDRLEKSIKASNAFQLAGVTGASHQYLHLPFEQNVAQILKALILLNMDDSDLLSRMWDDHDTTPLRRGDAMIVKSTLGLGQESLQDLIARHEVPRETVREARKKFAGYCRSVHIENEYIKKPADLVKLVGFLTHVPGFISRREPFSGYAQLYSGTVEFISADGATVESVPLDPYLKERSSYEFHRHITDIGSKNKVMERLFRRLDCAVSEKNVHAEHKMPLDRAQDMLFDQFGIYATIGVRPKKVDHQTSALLLAGTLTEAAEEYNVKFSLYELDLVLRTLSDLPKGAAAKVRSIQKQISDSRTIAALTLGFAPSGYYEPKTQKITISLPFETPTVISDIDIVGLNVAAQLKKKTFPKELQTLHLHNAYFQHVLLHEIGESIWAELPESAKTAWQTISDGNSDLARNYLTTYARKSPSEDFCESFAIYRTFGTHFRRRSKNEKIEAKYGFMKQLWNIDGGAREYSTNPGVPFSEVHGKITDTIEDNLLAEQLRELIEEDAELAVEERATFATGVLSLEALEDAILEEEEKQGANPIERAARKHKQAIEEDTSRQEAVQQVLVDGYLIGKTEQLLRAAKVETPAPDSFRKLLYNGHTKEAIDGLTSQKVKPKNARKIVTELGGLYEAFHDSLPDLNKTTKIFHGEETAALMRLVKGMEELSKK